MPEHSAMSRAQIAQLYDRINDLLRINSRDIHDTAAAASRVTGAARQAALALLTELRHARLEILAQHSRVFELELAYEASNRGRSEAEVRLAAGTAEATALVRSVEDAADLIRKVGQFAQQLARLIGVFR